MAISRRERTHTNIREEIKTIARQHMAEQGTAAISLRAIARAMELTAPALYRYFPSRDELLTALILDGFNALADTMQAAFDSSPQTDPLLRLRAVMAAYRDWALTHPVDFQLIYGNPIPGYHAPEATTNLAAARPLPIMALAIDQALAAGVLVPPPEYVHLPATLHEQLAESIARYGYATTPTTLNMLVMLWATGHGIVMLELFGHLQPSVGDVNAFFEERLTDLLRQIGARVP